MKPHILRLIGCIVLTLGPLTTVAQEKNTDLERAQALLAAGKYRDAADAFTKVIAVAPNESPAYQGRGQARFDLKDYAGSIADYDRALELDPKNAIAYNLRGFAKMLNGDPKGAMADYVRCIELNPNYAPVHTNRGILLRSSGDTQGAMQEYNRALEIAPQNERALTERAGLRLSLKDAVDAIKDYDQAVESNPKSATLYNLRGIAKKDNGDLKGAQADYNRAIELNPRFAPPLANRAYLRNKSGDTAGALADYSHALEIAPKDEYALVGRAQIRIGQGDNAGALTDCTTAIAANPKNASAHFNRGLAREKMGDPAGALEDFKSALALDPTMAAAKIRVTALQSSIGPAAAVTGEKPALPSTPTATSTQQQKPEASPSSAGKVPAAPAWVLEPKVSVDFANLTKADSTGVAATLAGGIEVVTGAAPGSAKKLSPLYDYTPPAASAAGAAHAKALGQAAVLHGSQETAVAGMHQAWEEAVFAAAYGDEAATEEALEIVRTHYETAMAAQNGLDQLVSAENDTPELPDAAEKKAKANEAYRRLLARTKAAVEADEAAPVTGRPGFKLVSIEMPATGTMAHSLGPGESFFGSGTDAGLASTWTDDSRPEHRPLSCRVQWSLPSVLMPGVPAKCRISATGDFYSFMNIGLDGLDIRTVGLLLGGVRGDTGTRGYDDFCPGVFSDEFDIVIPDNIVQALQNYRAGKGNAELKIRVRNQAEMQNHVLEDHGGNSKTPNQVPLEDVHLGYASLWANPTEPPVALIKISAYGRDNAVYSYRWTEDCGPEGATSTVVVNEPPLPDLPPDKVEEGKLHQANIGAIRTRLAQDEAELANAKDRDTRANLQRKIIGDKTDLLAEQDLLTSLEKGVSVHSRSPFDDYAHDRFVDSIRESQRDMASFQRERAAIPRLLALVPADQKKAMQAFVDRQLTPGVLSKMDHAKLREIANALSNQVEGYWQGQSALHTDEAEKYNDYLTRAERVKMIADTAVMIGSSGSGSAFRLAARYAAATGMASGGPVEAVRQASQYYSAPLHAAMEAVKAYPEGGVWGATKAGAIGFVMSKMVQLGAPEGQAEQLTVRESMQLAEFKQAQARGQALVRDFERARGELVAARDAGRPIAEVRALERQVADRAAVVQTDLHAKSFLKYQADQPLKTAFTEQIDTLHNSVQTRFDQIMAEAKWNPQQLRPIRNTSSVGSVNMDFDIMLVERPGITFVKDGQEFSMTEWQQEAQKAWEQAFHDTTGRSAGHAMEELTYSGHPEAYKDLSWVGRDPTKTSSIWATQAGDVTRYKAQNILGTGKVGALDYYTRLMEAARGTAKDIDTKLLNRLKLMKNRIPGPEGGARQKELLDRWTEMQGLLKDIGEGRIDPVHGSRMVRNLSGGYDIPDVINHASSMIGEFGKLAAKPVR